MALKRKKTKQEKSAKTAINWAEIYQRLGQASARLEKAEDISPEMLEQAWARRAAQFSREIKQESEGERTELVIAQIGREQYGLDVLYVYEIRPMQVITRVPHVPSWVAGVVNLRGKIMSVIDLAGYLGLPPAEEKETESQSQLVVVETAKMSLALLVDAILAVETINLNQIQEATSTVHGIRPEYVRGLVVREIAHSQGEAQMLTILDLPALLANPALIVHEEI